jgi:hypothetical protein
VRRAAKEAVRKVLLRAGDTPHFFDLSDAERLVRMVAMGFELGLAHRRRGSGGTRGRVQPRKAGANRRLPENETIPQL